MEIHSGVRRILGAERWYRGAGDALWAEVERSCGTELPRDYKDFVDGYGDALVFGHLYVPHPKSDPGLKDWILEEQDETEAVFGGTDLPGLDGVRSGGLVPWAVHNWNGDVCYFAPTLGGYDPENCPVVIGFRQGMSFVNLGLTFPEFMDGFLSGARVPRGWPHDGQIPWKAVDDSTLI